MTWEPLSNIFADEPTLVQYMPKNLTILNTQGWNQLKNMLELQREFWNSL